MKLTNKQQQEIDFLIKHFCKRQPTENDIDEYILATVKGVRDKEDKMSANILRNAKQRLDVMIKLWRKDLTIGLISKEELLEDFNCEYSKKLINSILKSVTKEYRKEVLGKSPEATILAISNFEDIVANLLK